MELIKNKLKIKFSQSQIVLTLNFGNFRNLLKIISAILEKM